MKQNVSGNGDRISRRVGMADEADSKSVVGNYVWVQVPLPAGSDESLWEFSQRLFLSAIPIMIYGRGDRLRRTPQDAAG